MVLYVDWLKENSLYEISITVKQIAKVVKKENKHTEIYKADITLFNKENESTLNFSDQNFEIIKDNFFVGKHSTNADSGSIVAVKDGKRLIISLDWISGKPEMVTGSAILTKLSDINQSLNENIFLTLGDLTNSIKHLPNKEKVKFVKNKVRISEYVLKTDSSYDDNKLRASLNGSSNNIKQYEDHYIAIAAAPKNPYIDPIWPNSYTWMEIKLQNTGSNIVVIKPFNNQQKNSGDPISVGYSFMGFGIGLGWTVGETTPYWATGATGIWSFKPDANFEDSIVKGVPVEGFVYGDNTGFAFIRFNTDISWVERHNDPGSTLGFNTISRNTISNHGEATLYVYN